MYAMSEFPMEEPSEKNQLSLLFTYLVHTQQFLNVLWLVKDNAVNFELGFLQFPYPGAPGGVRVSSNLLSAVFSKADGQKDLVVFSKEEIKKAIQYYNLLYDGQASTILSPEVPLVPIGDITRLSRSLYFLQGARAAWHLPEKVAYYCTCFETLVSTNSTELAHQVAERVAALIGKDSSDSLQIYRNLKRAYGTRSKLVHGGKLSDGNDRYLSDSINSDHYLRRLLYVLIENQEVMSAIEQNNEKVDQFFLEKIFGNFGKLHL